MIKHRSSGNLPLAFAAALVSLGGPVSAQPPGRSTPQPTPAVSRSDPRGPLIQVRVSPGGGCEYLWDGRATAESKLLETSVSHVQNIIRRLGGLENVTAANFPATNLQFGEDVPYRCVPAPCRRPAPPD